MHFFCLTISSKKKNAHKQAACLQKNASISMFHAFHLSKATVEHDGTLFHAVRFKLKLESDEKGERVYYYFIASEKLRSHRTEMQYAVSVFAKIKKMHWAKSVFFAVSQYFGDQNNKSLPKLKIVKKNSILFFCILNCQWGG
jgi:hypothetical protein